MCRFDGLTPTVTTKQEIVDKYVDPVPKDSKDDYFYNGIHNGSNKSTGRANDHSIGIRLENDVVKEISIAYADLTKEY